jgi:hypothetical protein
LLPSPQAVQLGPQRDDNSNTQFAIMGLWAARRYGVPTAPAFALVGQRFRASQLGSGDWDYHLTLPLGRPSMTCAALLGLAASHGSAREAAAPWLGPAQPAVEDAAITRGLRALGAPLNRPTTKLNTYFLWSLERVGVTYDLPTIGNVSWYRWGVALLLPTQRLDGSWHGGGYPGSAAALDTSMALLFLRRAHLAPDLTTTLRRYVVVADPAALLAGAAQPAATPVDLWLLTPDPDSRPLAVPVRQAGAPPREKEIVAVTLGDARTGTQTERRLTVRSALPFRITAIEGADKECAAEVDNHERKTEHVLTIRLQPNQPGERTRTLRLVTDLPNGGVATFDVKVRAEKAQ